MSRKVKVLPELHEIEITGIAAEGKALTRTRLREADETPIVVFVGFAAPGDIVNLKIDKKRKSYAEAHITEIIRPSDIRIEPVCSHFTICGGCKWQHIPYSEQLKFKRQLVVDALTRIGKIKLPEIKDTLGCEKFWHYRNKMEYTFSNKKWRTFEEIKSGKEFTDAPEALGFHIPGCFDKVLHIENCYLQDEIGDKIRNFIYQFAIDNNYSFYDLKKNKGLLRTLMIRLSSNGELMVCPVFGENDPDKIKTLLDSIKSEFPQITSLIYVINQKFNDTITDQEILLHSGLPYITEEMEGLKFRISAKSFYQTNSLQAYELYKTARRFAGLDKESDHKPLVYDLYTGTGTIANFVARNSLKVIGIEYVPEAIEDAKLNSKVNGIDNTLFYAGDMKDVLTDDFVSQHGHPDVIIVDPPRAGMHESVVEVLLNTAPDVIVYVSCNPSTQARDLAMLDSKYEVTDVQPVDMFPHTHHIENVVRLQLRK